jgi:citrate synthase
MRRQLLDREAGDDQFAAFAVDVAQPRGRCHHSFKTRSCHTVTLAPGYDAVNVDRSINMSSGAWIPAAEAARLLGVSRATLYAYVSRGFVRSQTTAGPSRERGYSREDVERLRRRTEERRHPDKAAAHALQWGMPILESAIALIDGSALYYRGHNAVELARSRSLEEVASLVWTGQFHGPPGRPRPGGPVVRKPDLTLPFAARAHVMLAEAGARDPLAFDLRPERVAATGWQILRLLARAATGSPATGGGSIDHHLARAWGVRGRGADVIRAALILCADHELNVSSFTARCVASAASTPYAVVIAGLAALQGTRHGGVSARVEATLGALRRERRLTAALAERLRRGESIDGFGHQLYRHGDPRAAALLTMLREQYGRSAEHAFIETFVRTAATVAHEQPNIDFALAATARVLRLPAGAPFTLFAIGRTIGWIGHALEQYATGQLIRPRAKYVGVAPP